MEDIDVQPFKRVYFSSLEWDRSGTEEMRFHLTYRGNLKAHRVGKPGEPDKMAPHVHDIRRRFHWQMKELWRTNRFLNEHKSWPSDYGLPSAGERAPLVDIVAQCHTVNGFRFVPLVRSDWHLECSLSILFLRRDQPGSLIHMGDIDNRIKTLIDALRYPLTPQEAGGATPQPDEDPFFVLLEKDELVTALSVETGRLLRPREPNEDESSVDLYIEVEIRPYNVTNFNLSFG